jgi:predicted ATP-dependent serine protease
MGGFLREGFYLVWGDPASGKSTLALQYALGRSEAGERSPYISLTESRRAATHRERLALPPPRQTAIRPRPRSKTSR